MTRDAPGSLLIVAVSGRALARAAADAGYAPLVADFFADRDTQALAAHACKLPGKISRGFTREALESGLETLCASAPSPPLGVIYGSGFEDRPDLLEQIAVRWPLLGNDAATLAAINDPERFSAALARMSIPHPPTQMARPDNPDGWVVKRPGGAGGSHVAPAQNRTAGRNVYFQKRMPGRPVSALFVAHGETAAVLGFSEQWSAPAPGKPWRYGGAAQPAVLSQALRDQLAELVARVSSEFRLTGLNSADFLVDAGEPYLLEVNPRPGSTLDIFGGATPPLLRFHLDAVLHGRVPAGTPIFREASASAIVFAPTAVTVPEDMTWPPWAADLPKAGERIDKERPICTVLARAGSMDRARQLVQKRIGDVLRALKLAGTRPHAD